MKESLYGELSVIGMRGCEEFTAQVDSYLKDWRRHDQEGSFLVDCACPRFGSGEGKGALHQSLRGNDYYGNGIERITVTGRSGLSEKIALPAPPPELSKAPHPKEQPYSTYDIEATAEGYYPKRILNVAVFAGILSILPLQMIPNAGITSYTTSPTDSNFSISYENEELE